MTNGSTETGCIGAREWSSAVSCFIGFIFLLSIFRLKYSISVRCRNIHFEQQTLRILCSCSLVAELHVQKMRRCHGRMNFNHGRWELDLHA